MSSAAVCRSLAKLFVEVFNKVLTDKVCSVIIIAVFREVALNIELCDDAALVLNRSNLCIFDC